MIALDVPARDSGIGAGLTFALQWDMLVTDGVPAARLDRGSQAGTRFALAADWRMHVELVELKVQGVAVDHNQSPVVVLKDVSGDHQVEIWIGPAEAVAISMELEQRQPPRPMTHDLIRNIFNELSVKVARLIITDVQDNTYFARLMLVVNSDEKDIDCRPSDGIAIALRTEAPIFMPGELLSRIDQERKQREASFMVDSGGTVH
ncbi:MAG: bifunctional nuclease family protein [Armatimonadota bacterium]|nr:MAG: bifunctional nuclease family protein [Armatimonadota bacterium]